MIAAVWHSAQRSTLVPYISNANLCAAISSVGRHSRISVCFYLWLWYAVPYEARLATIHIRSWSFPLLPAAKCELGLQHHKKQSRFMPGGQCLRAKLTDALSELPLFFLPQSYGGCRLSSHSVGTRTSKFHIIFLKNLGRKTTKFSSPRG